MSIRTKLALILFVAVAGFLGIDLLLLRAGGARSFAALERSRSELQIDGITRAFDSTYDELAALARTGISESDPASNAGVDLALAIDKAGQVVEYRFVNEEGLNDILREVPNEAMGFAHPFMKSWRTGTPPRGLFETQSGLMLIGSAIDRVQNQTVLSIRGRWLNDSALTPIQALAGSTFSCSTIPEFEADHRHQSVPIDGETSIVELNDKTLLAANLINDVRGLPVAVVESPVLRNELATMESIHRQEILTALFVAILFPLVLLVLIQVVVTGPLGRLSDHAQAIGEADDASRRLDLKRTDEIGALASEFDRMLDRLESSRRAQRNAARMSGRSAVATTVMHGVGNIVNSVNVSATMAADSISEVDLADLKAIESALREHQGHLDDYLANDPQGVHLLSFFAATIETYGTRIETASSEVASMLGSVEEVKSLVSSLEKEEMHESTLESIRIADEVEDALARSGLREAAHGTVCKVSVDASIELVMDPHQLSDILDIVLENAREAVAEKPIGEREVEVRLSRLEGHVRFSVEDNGEGIDPDRLGSLFEMNETTRGEGRGTGLHMAALAARALGGELHAWSAGLGQGAIFTLEIPLADVVAA